MIRNIWTVFCQRALEDKRSNNLTLVDCIEKITLQLPPQLVTEERITIQSDYNLATFWHNSNPENDVSVEASLSFRFPSGKEELLVPSHSFTVKSGKYYKWITNVKAMHFAGEGLYHFIMRIREHDESRWKRVATIPLSIAFNVREDALVVNLGEQDDGKEKE